jgi:hypothetical protein
MWQEKIVRKLLEAGHEGVPMRVLAEAVMSYATYPEVTAYLESLWIEHAVQRFPDYRGSVWRATDKLPSIDV